MQALVDAMFDSGGAEGEGPLAADGSVGKWLSMWQGGLLVCNAGLVITLGRLVQFAWPALLWPSCAIAIWCVCAGGAAVAVHGEGD